jgi:lipopolysaccharide transport system ATP-binding protein
MPSPIIAIDKLGKKYTIHQDRHGRPGSHRISEELVRAFKRPFQRLTKGAERSSPRSEFWALRDVSFEVAEGDVVGIIGRNGAGKSTLLKILSRITEPTEGRIRLNGRVASLLEVGTGFHPELTGRENIFLNGSILGMRRAEIRSKLAEIIEFSGVEQFIDTPVKRYSSGMGLRLAFSVAAHLEPEILIVDEVLAVGDAAFQERCLSKMSHVASAGRTVLFVSHQMQAVANLCDTALQLDRGRIVDLGSPREVVNRYLAAAGSSGTSERVWTFDEAPGDEIVRLLRVRVEDPQGASPAAFPSENPIYVLLDIHCFETPASLCVGFDLLASDGMHVLRSYQTDGPVRHSRLTRGHNTLRCQIPAGLLNGGTYRLSPRISLHNLQWCVREESVVQFNVSLTHGKSPFWNSLSGQSRGGVIAPIFDWELA